MSCIRILIQPCQRSTITDLTYDTAKHDSFFFLQKVGSTMTFKISINNALFQLPEEHKKVLKEQIINCVQNEPDKNVRRKVADLAAEVARNLTDDDGNNLWPEFLKFLFDMASSPSAEAKEIALHMFASVPGVFGNQVSSYNINIDY